MELTAEQILRWTRHFALVSFVVLLSIVYWFLLFRLLWKSLFVLATTRHWFCRKILQQIAMGVFNKFWRKLRQSNRFMKIAQYLYFISSSWTVQSKKEPSIILKIESKHRQVIQISFRRVLGVLVTWWCFMYFFDFSKNLIKTSSGDFKYVSEKFEGY